MNYYIYIYCYCLQVIETKQISKGLKVERLTGVPLASFSVL